MIFSATTHTLVYDKELANNLGKPAVTLQWWLKMYTARNFKLQKMDLKC